MSNEIIIKGDKRFKLGNIKKSGNELRGNPETMKLERMEVPGNSQYALNPPIVVSAELAEKLKQQTTSDTSKEQVRTILATKRGEIES